MNKKYAKALHSNSEMNGCVNSLGSFILLLPLAIVFLFCLSLSVDALFYAALYTLYSMAKNSSLLFSSELLDSSYSFVFNGRFFADNDVD